MHSPWHTLETSRRTPSSSLPSQTATLPSWIPFASAGHLDLAHAVPPRPSPEPSMPRPHRILMRAPRSHNQPRVPLSNQAQLHLVQSLPDLSHPRREPRPEQPSRHARHAKASHAGASGLVSPCGAPLQSSLACFGLRLLDHFSVSSPSSLEAPRGPIDLTYIPQQRTTTPEHIFLCS